MNLNVISNYRNIEQPLKSNIINVVVKQKSSNEDIDIKVDDFISTRLAFIKGSFQEDDNRKTMMLSSRQGPIYRHYTHKEDKNNKIAFGNRFTILPEIRGQNLFGSEQEMGEKDTEYPIKVEEAKVDTLRQLQSSILRYGSKGENIWMGFTSTKFHPMLVRPGFSARRYLANLSRNLNETLVKKLMCDGYLLEKNLYTTNSVMPQIRRRLSDDLSRYPEPYRILKQMLMSPGPLNEYSFVWNYKRKFREDGSFVKNDNMEHGDIKILSKKNKNDGKDEFEEVQYSELSGQKKKTILSNLLMKSAMHHALKVKEEMMEYNDKLLIINSKHKVHNLHIPVIKFDIKAAITDLLTKETLQTLTIKEMELPLNVDPVNDGFKGSKLMDNHYEDWEDREIEGIPRRDKNLVESSINAKTIEDQEKDHNTETTIPHFKGRNLNRPKVTDSQLTNLKNKDSHKESVFITEPRKDEKEIFSKQNLTLRLNQSHPRSKLRKKLVKSENISDKESMCSDFHNIRRNPLDDVTFSNTKDIGKQDLAFVEMIKAKAQLAASLKDIVQPYGKYRDTNLAAVGDIDPTMSFSNWKYNDFISCQVNAADNKVVFPTPFPSLNGTTVLKTDESQSRLVHLLQGQADSVAEAVLERSDGGVDFASDVNVAIQDIIGQSPVSRQQIWNLEVDNLEKEFESY